MCLCSYRPFIASQRDRSDLTIQVRTSAASCTSAGIFLAPCCLALHLCKQRYLANGCALQQGLAVQQHDHAAILMSDGGHQVSARMQKLEEELDVNGSIKILERSEDGSRARARIGGTEFDVSTLPARLRPA